MKSGQVRFVYADMAFLGPESLDASEAARCAQEQGKFWEYHDLLFANQQGENQGAFKRDKLVEFAKQLQLDEAQFTQCIDTHKYRSLVQESGERGRRLGVEGTPSIFVNTRFLPGFVDSPQLEQIIQEELKK